MKKTSIYNIIAAVVIFVFGILLLSQMKLSYSSTLTSQIAHYVLDNILQTGAINVVCAMLLDFRAYDTLGEILIIFVSISAIILLTRRKL